MKRLLEYQQKDLKQKFGLELANKFLELRKGLPSPQNQLDYWMKKDQKDLEDFLNNYKSKTQKDKEAREEGATKIYDDSNWQVIHITSYAAAVQYGKGSKWCICGNYPGHETRGQEYFDSYLKLSYSGYYLFLNKHPKDPTVDAKYMVCPFKKDPDQCNIWTQTDTRLNYIPNCNVRIEGLPNVAQFYITDDGVLERIRVENESSTTPDEVIEIPDTVKVLGSHCLRYKRSIAEVHLPNSLTTIETGACVECGVSELDIPDSVQSIGGKAFMNCINLKQITLGSGVTTLSHMMLMYCDELATVIIRGVIKDIDDYWIDLEDNKPILKFDTGKNSKLLEWCKANNLTDIQDLVSGKMI